jgi:hypothetical protein
MSESIGAYSARKNEEQLYFRPSSGVGTAAIILIALTAVLGVVSTVLEWRATSMLDDFVQLTGTSADDVLSAGNTADTVDRLGLLMLFIAAVVFLVWAWRSRINAELIAGPDTQRRRRGWTIGGWICPVANLFVPFQIMTDIYQASSPRRTGLVDNVLKFWWAAWLIGNGLTNIAARDLLFGTPTLGQVHTAAVLDTIGAGFQVVAAVLIAVIINKVTNWQYTNPMVTDHAGMTMG